MECGYRIEDERPVPVNGLCSFIAIRDMPQDADVRVGSTGAHSQSGALKLVVLPIALVARQFIALSY
jgi:hypothetical protein